MVLKATRGAGLALGLAEDLAQATAWLGDGDLSALAADLDDPARHPALERACAEADQARCVGAVPSCGLVAALVSAGAGIAPDAAARDVPDAVWTQLDRLAARLLVPESARSRAAGAGAAISDND